LAIVYCKINFFINNLEFLFKNSTVYYFVMISKHAVKISLTFIEYSLNRD